jgi:HEAT repeat protein
VKKHNDEKVRLWAYQGLVLRFGKQRPVALPAKLVLPHLIDAAKDKSANIRVLGVQGLGGLGADAKDALPVVMGLLNDPDARVRSQAQLALKQIEK